MRAGICILLALAGSLGAIKKAGADAPATLVNIKRVFVDRFTGGETAAQLRDMVLSSLANAHLFQVTEDEESADVILRGSGEDLVFTDQHQLNDRLNVGLYGTANNRNLDISSGSSSGINAGESESSHIVERKHEASASVRMVNSSGDVIWSSTKESFGGKFRGASADVADKLVKQLIQDIGRAKASSATQAGNPVR